MKTLSLLSLFSFLSAGIFAQTAPLTQSQIDERKKNGTLSHHFSIANPNPSARFVSPVYPPHEVQSTNACECLIPLDSTFSVGQFDYQGGSGGPGVPPDYRNDDWSTSVIPLPFNFCYSGQSVNSIYLNNNGNISISATYPTFTADSFPSNGFTMLAPFWADVDTRGASSGLVYYKVTTSHVIVRWDHVGYYGIHDDLLNTFQLIITDGNDSLVPGGNTAFCYGDMQWTTGDASSGVGGFGGTPSSVGANFGDGINYVQFGRFDQPGVGYDGPFNLNDSVDWLDSSVFIFDLCPANVPPIALNNMSDTVYLIVGDTADIDISFTSPEMGQVTSLTVNTGGLNNLTTIANTSGNFAQYKGRLIADVSNLGFNTFSVTADDNGLPPQTRTVSRVYHIDTQAGIAQVMSPFVTILPNPFSSHLTLHFPAPQNATALLRIFNSIGEVVLEKEIKTEDQTLNLAALPQGIYLASVRTEEGVFTERLIK